VMHTSLLLGSYHFSSTAWGGTTTCDRRGEGLRTQGRSLIASSAYPEDTDGSRSWLLFQTPRLAQSRGERVWIRATYAACCIWRSFHPLFSAKQRQIGPTFLINGGTWILSGLLSHQELRHLSRISGTMRRLRGYLDSLAEGMSSNSRSWLYPRVLPRICGLLGRQSFWTKAERKVRILFGSYSPASQKRPRLARDSLCAKISSPAGQPNRLEAPLRELAGTHGLGNCHVPDVSLITVLMVMQERPRRLEIGWH
jgi:hypothetical protein